jgi:two-component system chemotaxis sensor kinase CheA
LQNSDFLKDFLEEASTHVESVEDGLLKLESGVGGADLIHGIFRNVHSVKGTAGFFGLKSIVALSHAMENLFGEIRNGNLIIDKNMIDLLLSANDTLKSMICDVENSNQLDVSEYLKKISAIMGESGEIATAGFSHPDVSGYAPPGQAAIITEEQKELILNALRQGHSLYRLKIAAVQNTEALKEKVASIGLSMGVLNDPSAILVTTVLDGGLLSAALDLPLEDISEMFEDDLLAADCAPTPEGPPGLPEIIKTAPTGKPPANDRTDRAEAPPAAGNYCGITTKLTSLNYDDTVRVHISLLNNLLDLASEMVLGRNQLLRILESQRKKIAGLNAVLQNIDSITTELQEKIMQTRMHPVDNVFKKFPRFIRELSSKLNKEIDLKMSGGEVELDKSIIEALGDPLTHLIRNAVDHGIEPPEVRDTEGKPRTGTVYLHAYHEGGHVIIDVMDDGMGINTESIKNTAIQKGLYTQSEIAQMHERELLTLLFNPGFSTAAKITDLSGRGVGMDVVKTNIEKMGGSIEIMTSPGEGTTFRLTLPLTLAIISSLIVEVNGQKFALPQVNLQGLVRIKPGDPVRRIERVRNTEVLRLRDRLLPIVHLNKLLGIRNNRPESGVIRVLVIKSGSKRFGLVVDSIHDGEEILVKPIPRYLNSCQCYSGVTIMGDGRTAMILDAGGIAARAGLKFAENNSENMDSSAVYSDENITERQNLLLFKCSGPESFGIDLSMVARVEKICDSQIEIIGDKEYIQYRGEALRVIRLEDYLPVARVKNDAEILHVIIPKLVKYPMGILIEKIHDTMESKIVFNQEDIKARGIIGSAILNSRIVLFINIYELFELAAPDKYLSDSAAPSDIKKTILLAEDTPFFAKIGKKYIESAGYNVLEAANGKEAWDILQNSRVDALVSDIEMPLMDGFELIRRIRSDSSLAWLPTVALTSKSDQRSVEKGMRYGFDFYEIKLDRERLLEKIKLALQKRSDAV